MLFDPIQSGHLGVGSDEIGSNMRTNTIDRRRSLPRRTIPLTFDFFNSHISPTEWLTLLCFLPFIIGFASAKHFPIGIYILSMKTLRLSFSLCLTPIAQYWIFVTNENSSDIQCMWNKLFTNKGYVQDIIFPILWSVVLNYQTLCVSIMFLWRP